MAGNSRIVLLLMLALLSTGCRKPTDGYALVSRQTAAADGGRYSFEIDLDDSCRTYSTAVAARVATARLDRPDIELQLSVTSPSGATAVERIAFPLSGNNRKVRNRRNEGDVRDYLWPWRENIRPEGQDLGRWRIVITLPDSQEFKAVEGIGLSYQGTPWEKAN